MIDLYANLNREISQTKTMIGANEVQAVYDYPNAADSTELIREGTKRFKELISTDEMEVSLEGGSDINVDIGDVIGGHDYITGVDVKVTVTKKVFKINRYSEDRNRIQGRAPYHKPGSSELLPGGVWKRDVCSWHRE